jgi:hypothetical protein
MQSHQITYNLFEENNMQVVFYNAHQNGDVILSRQGVRWIVDHLGPNHEYFFIHNKNPESLFFHERIKVISLPFNFHGCLMPQMQHYFKQQNQFQNALWIDTWIGSMEPSKYVLDHNDNDRWIQLMPDENGNYILGKCVEVWDNTDWQEMFWKKNVDKVNEYLRFEFTTKTLPYPTREDIIPKWQGHAPRKQTVDDILAKNSSYKISILICNSDTQSGQRENFSYEKILENLIEEKKDVMFYFTDNKENFKFDNVTYINDLMNFPNLNEIEYISKYMDLLVTSMSGPGCMVLNNEVFNDESKTMIYFTRNVIGLYHKHGNCKYVQTEDWSAENIFETIKVNLEEKL